MTARAAILFATPGTSSVSALGVYDRIGAAAARRFPGVETRWCFTSGPVRSRLAAQGVRAAAPEEALAGLAEGRFERAAVVPLHLTDGMEYRELAELALLASAARGAPRLALGRPLLVSEDGWRRTLEALLASLPEPLGPRDRAVVVVHGSKDPQGYRTLIRAAARCRRVDPRLMLGMLLGRPNLDDVTRALSASRTERVWLLPGFVAAGRSVTEDVAGTGEGSWASAFARAGLRVAPLVRALADIEGVVDVWLDAAAELLAESGASGSAP